MANQGRNGGANHLVLLQKNRPPSTLHKPVDLRGSKIGGIARADARRLTSGAIALTARLDLHGETLAGAYAALTRFIVEKQHQKHFVMCW